MDEDDFEEQTERYLADGRRNVQNAELIFNWCANIRVTRSGGVGMIEQMTGVPIGHMGLACSHASGGGLSCWDIRESFVNFHRRNCDGCEHRTPVKLPNAQHLVDQYKKKLTRQKTERETAHLQAEKDRLKREEQRSLLRTDDPNVIAILDALERLDIVEPPKDVDEQLRASASSISVDENKTIKPEDELLTIARVAPDVWPPELFKHLIGVALSDGPYKLKELASRLLLTLPANDSDKARVCFARLSTSATDEKFVGWGIQHIDLINEKELAEVISSATYRAGQSYGIASRHSSNPDLLNCLAEMFPEAILSQLTKRYKSGNGHDATVASRMIGALGSGFSELIEPYLKVSVVI